MQLSVLRSNLDGISKYLLKECPIKISGLPIETVEEYREWS